MSDEAASRPALSRRAFLKVGALAAGAGACRSGRRGPDYAGDAQKLYAQSLRAMRRTTVTAAGAEVAEQGNGLLSLEPDALLAHRDARPGQPDFDVLVIGSGYGGAICAARLAARRKPGVKIGVLERGREWVPGTFPSSLANFRPFSRHSSWLRAQLATNPLGLFGFYNQGDVTVVNGSGLGGSSLINCEVVIETEEDVFRQAAWPEELRAKSVLRPYYDRARRVLAPQRTPEDRFPPKLKAHLGTATVLAAQGTWPAGVAYPVGLAVTFADRTNEQGMRQHGCVQCGDCSTGCNVGAKHSLDMNYLPLAWQAGAQLFTQTEVERIETAGDRYRLHCILRSGRLFAADRRVLTARMVIVAAGTIGTNEVLLRSRAGGLPLSDWVGKGFSGNGNNIWFVDYQLSPSTVTTNSAGVGVAHGTPPAPVGPTIQGIIDFRRGDRPLERRVVFEDVAQASALAKGVASLQVADLNRAITLLACGHDTADGEIRLERDEASVRWPEYATQRCVAEMAALVAQYASAYGGRGRAFGVGGPTTAHPLGGCRMAATAAEGVVNHRGQAFDAGAGRGGRAVQPGLYVADASIVPTALGNNPLLTISALAERIAELIVADPANAALFKA